MSKKVFIDGQEGTTGLEIHARIRGRPELAIVEIPGHLRKDPSAKAALMNDADLVVLCLPDAAAVESAALVENPKTKILDASTAHRTADGWIYGLPELAEGQRAAIRGASRVSNPGCYATGFLLAVRPLVEAGVLPVEYPTTVHAVSGYSGGGKRLIQAFREHPREGQSPPWTIRPYALGLTHKHVPEMQRHAGLTHRPLFCPAVGGYYQGMLVSVPLHVSHLERAITADEVLDLYAARYANEPFVRIMPLGGGSALEGGYLNSTDCNGTNRVELFVSGTSEQILLVARLDNLGKGASGAAVQNMNLMLGFDETTGLQ